MRLSRLILCQPYVLIVMKLGIRFLYTFSSIYSLAIVMSYSCFLLYFLLQSLSYSCGFWAAIANNIMLTYLLFFQVCTAKMNLSDEVDLEDYVSRPDKISAAEVRC